MSKAINWSQEFHEEILSEDSSSLKLALRLGSLYFDNAYYADGDIIDVRVDHKIVRKARIVGDSRLSKIKDLTAKDLSMCKKLLRNHASVAHFLANNYNCVVGENDIITVIRYKNLNKEEAEIFDDPHL